MEEMLERDFTIVPTLSSWEPGIDVMRYLWSEWHEEYTLPALWRYFQPNPMNHWAFYWDWTTAPEIEFKNAYAPWMQFVNEYKNMGGRITVGSDSGFGLKLFGFDTIRELEMLQTAGFHPLEVMDAATRKGAELLGIEKDVGTVEPGKKADLLVIDENPLLNFKVLYGTGHMRLNQSTLQVERVEGAPLYDQGRHCVRLPETAGRCPGHGGQGESGRSRLKGTAGPQVRPGGRIETTAKGPLLPLNSPRRLRLQRHSFAFGCRGLLSGFGQQLNLMWFCGLNQLLTRDR